MRINKFTRQYGGVYDCEVCGRATRETGEGESMAELCARCYYEAGVENEHLDDGHAVADPDCPTCRTVEQKHRHEWGPEQRDESGHLYRGCGTCGNKRYPYLLDRFFRI